MYNSPIKTSLTYRELVKEVNKDTDEQIYKAVVACGVDVDRDELLRALAYDRGQYDEGFAAGYRAATPRWIPVEERLPEEGSFVLGAQYDRIAPEDGYEVEYFLYGSKNVYNGSLWYSWSDNGGEDMVVTHWMPLPEPPKEVE